MCPGLPMMNSNTARRMGAADSYRQRYKGYSRRRLTNQSERMQVPIDEDQELSIAKIRESHKKKHRDPYGMVYRLPARTVAELSSSKESMTAPQAHTKDTLQEGGHSRPHGQRPDQQPQENANFQFVPFQKADRSYSEPLIFPPIASQKATNKPSQLQPIKSENVRKIPPPEKIPAEPLKNIGVKFPIVSRQDLYKHLGIPMEGTVYRRVREAGRRSKMGGSIERQSRAPTRNTDMQAPTPNPRNGLETERSGNFQFQQTLKNGLALQKLEVYRKWQENQQSHENMPVESDKEVHMQPKLQSKENTMPVKLAPLPLPNQKKSHPTDKSSRNPGRTSREQTHSERVLSSRLRVESPPAPVPPELLNKQYSNKSWHSWRNKNDSYAYDDVDAYIEDNELMDEEKEEWIKKWVKEVNKAMKEAPPMSRESDGSLPQSFGKIQSPQ